MKKLFLITIIIISTITSTLAETTVQYARIGTDNAVITQSERTSKPEEWLAVFDGRIELIKDQKDFPMSMYLQIIKNIVDTDDLDQLQIRDMYINKKNIQIINNRAVLSFVLSIKYYDNIFQQGTVNVSGKLEFDLNELRLINNEPQYYTASSPAEEFGRESGYHEQFKEEFVEVVVATIVDGYLGNTETIETLFENLNEESLKIIPTENYAPLM
ncbi:MAG: hypothetical protein HON90_08020 [Halobacteriovoraceae bacterium]|jgi:hypothetical protein|nr:hypothetical protein [Halobacteriovoraceae bacterium]